MSRPTACLDVQLAERVNFPIMCHQAKAAEKQAWQGGGHDGTGGVHGVR